MTLSRTSSKRDQIKKSKEIEGFKPRVASGRAFGLSGLLPNKKKKVFFLEKCNYLKNNRRNQKNNDVV